MKKFKTTILNRTLEILCPDEFPPFCDDTTCRLRGKIYTCYVHDYKYCQEYSKPKRESAILFGQMGGRRWNQI